MHSDFFYLPLDRRESGTLSGTVQIQKMISVKQTPLYINVDERGELSWIGHGGFAEVMIQKHGLEMKKVAKKMARRGVFEMKMSSNLTPVELNLNTSSLAILPYHLSDLRMKSYKIVQRQYSLMIQNLKIKYGCREVPEWIPEHLKEFWLLQKDCNPPPGYTSRDINWAEFMHEMVTACYTFYFGEDVDRYVEDEEDDEKPIENLEFIHENFGDLEEAVEIFQEEPEGEVHIEEQEQENLDKNVGANNPTFEDDIEPNEDEDGDLNTSNNMKRESRHTDSDGEQIPCSNCPLSKGIF